MDKFKQPLSIFFVWHPHSQKLLQEALAYCFNKLKRDSRRPFSRALNIPIFFLTSSSEDTSPPLESRSEKNIVFLFLCKNIVASPTWVTYIQNLFRANNYQIIPIALDNTAFNLPGLLQRKNFIRAYKYEDKFFKENLLISISHELYRLALNENFSHSALGKDTAVKLFISHTKDGKQGINLAIALKEFIDFTPMRNFFDATDIAPGYMFDDEIITHIQQSTMVAIHSDPYSSRYWCQREIQCAKENDRPIIAVDCLEEYEDRRFPLAANIPGVHLHLEHHMEVKQKDLYRIVSAALIETIRFFYAKQLLERYREHGWFPHDSIILSRPPEFSDFTKTNIERIQGGATFVYPEPPIYEEELSVLKKLGVQAFTPLSAPGNTIPPVRIGISISDPTEAELLEIGMKPAHLRQLSQDLARYLLAQGNTLAYGGDLRIDGFTDFLLKEGQAFQSRTQQKSVALRNFSAWPIYNDDSAPPTDWKAKYSPMLEMLEIPPPDDVLDLIPDIKSFVPPDTPENNIVWARCLTTMREMMIEQCDARICAGGRHSGYNGAMPGVLEEIILTIQKKKPLFLLGGFGGITHSVCEFIRNDVVPEKLTEQWQMDNNPGRADLLRFVEARNLNFQVDIDMLKENLSFANLYNGLSDEENKQLFATPYVDTSIHLIFKGLKTISGI